MPYKPANFCWGRPIGERLYTHSDFCVFCRKTCKQATHDAQSWRLTCIHAIISRSPWGYGWVAPDKRHCKQWTSSLFCGFLPNHFIQDLCLWRTSQEFVKIFLWNAVCSTGHRSIIDCCFRACQRSSLCGRKTTAIKKTSHLILEMSMNEAFIWLSGLHFIDKKIY